MVVLFAMRNPLGDVVFPPLTGHTFVEMYYDIAGFNCVRAGW
jgi:hypothetical protein